MRKAGCCWRYSHPDMSKLHAAACSSRHGSAETQINTTTHMQQKIKTQHWNLYTALKSHRTSILRKKKKLLQSAINTKACLKTLGNPDFTNMQIRKHHPHVELVQCWFWIHVLFKLKDSFSRHLSLKPVSNFRKMTSKSFNKPCIHPGDWPSLPGCCGWTERLAPAVLCSASSGQWY